MRPAWSIGSACGAPGACADLEGIQPAGLGTQLIPYSSVVDVRRDPLDFVYRFRGTAHVDLKRADYTDRAVLAHKPDDVGRMVFSEYQRVGETEKPVRIVDSFQMECRPLVVTRVIVRMPLSDDGETVTHIAS